MFQAFKDFVSELTGGQKDPHRFEDRDYRLAAAALLVIAALLGLAALNKLRLSPALARGEPGALPRFRRSVAAEYVLICAVLVVTAVLTGFFSPRPGEREATAATPARAPA